MPEQPSEESSGRSLEQSPEQRPRQEDRGQVLEETTERAVEHFRRPSGLVALWAGVMAGPTAWALSQQVAYLFATLNCTVARGLMLSPVMFAALLLAASGVVLSWRNWRLAGGGLVDEKGGAVARSRMLSVAGMLLGGYSLMVIIAMWVPVFFYRECER